jgi:23S rRNA pseudouridine2605 synthase
MRFTRNTHTGDAEAGDSDSNSKSGDARAGGERIAKVIARAGVCSRRDAERLIAEGRVTLNGRKIDSPAVNVTPRDKVAVDGAGLPTAEGVRLWRYHKPKGRVTTHRDPEGRPTVFDALPPELPRVISVGRLDFNTEGLLLLTNDGALARHLERPTTGWLRRYRVRARGAIAQAELDVLKDGITIDGIHYGPVEAKLDRIQGGGNIWLTLGLREGKNREVRRIMEHLKLTVNRLIRLSFGPFALGDLEAGAIEEVKRRVLAEQLGTDMAETLGLGVKQQGSTRQPRAAAARDARPGGGAAKGRSGDSRHPGGKPSAKSQAGDKSRSAGKSLAAGKPLQAGKPRPAGGSARKPLPGGGQAPRPAFERPSGGKPPSRPLGGKPSPRRPS